MNFQWALSFTTTLAVVLTAASAFAFSENLFDGEIVIAGTSPRRSGHAIAFQRLVRSDGDARLWHLRQVTVRDVQGRVIATSPFARWDENRGLLFLESPDRVLTLTSKP